MSASSLPAQAQLLVRELDHANAGKRAARSPCARARRPRRACPRRLPVLRSRLRPAHTIPSARSFAISSGAMPRSWPRYEIRVLADAGSPALDLPIRLREMHRKSVDADLSDLRVGRGRKESEGAACSRPDRSAPRASRRRRRGCPPPGARARGRISVAGASNRRASASSSSCAARRPATVAKRAPRGPSSAAIFAASFCQSASLRQAIAIHSSLPRQG